MVVVSRKQISLSIFDTLDVVCVDFKEYLLGG